MDAFRIALSGLRSATTGVAVSANNVANLQSKDYRAKRLDLEEQPEGGVRPSKLTESAEPVNPGGSNVDLATEFTNLLVYEFAYKSNLKVIQAEGERLRNILDIKA